MSGSQPRAGGPGRRRSFAPAEKLQLLIAYDAACRDGLGTRYLREQGLYPWQINDWRKLRDDGVLEGRSTGAKAGQLSAEQAHKEAGHEGVPYYVRRYRELATMQEIANEIGVSRQRVQQLLKEFGVPSFTIQQGNEARTRQLLDARGTEIREALLHTRSIEETARLTDLPANVVKRAAGELIPDVKILLRAIRNPSKKYNEAELIDLLHSAADGVPGPLTTGRYDVYVAEHPQLSDGRPTPGHQTMALRFGSWVGALAAANLPSNPSSQVPKLFENEEAAISAVVRLWRDRDTPPTASDYEGWSAHDAVAPSLSTARKLAGSWNTMLLLAWEVVHQIELPQDDLDAALPPALLAEIAQPKAPDLTRDLGGNAQPYVVADENASYQAAMEMTVAGYKAQERALTYHAKLQNAVASALQTRDLPPLSPTGQDVLFDLAFALPDGRKVVVEVKSATEANIEMQLRIGLGQVLRYARQLSVHGSVLAMLAIERALPDQDWVDLLRELDVAVLIQTSLAEDLDTFLNALPCKLEDPP